MTQWSSDYNGASGVQMSYSGVGSGQGIKDLIAKKVDFAGSDAPVQAAQAAAGATGVVHIPEALGGVALTYNVPGVTQLRLNGTVLAGIYLGQITKWNDPALVALNPNANLPANSIVPVHRSDGSGTTYAFTDYLSKVSTAWQKGPGTGTSVTWPLGIAGAKSAGVANAIQQNSNTIGYVETGYATSNGMAVAQIQNAAGVFQAPTLAGVSAAAAASSNLPTTGDADWSHASIVNAPGNASYPISTFTYVVVYKNLSQAYPSMDAKTAKALASFLSWAVTSGQADNTNLQYSTLPPNVVTMDKATIAQLTFDGKPALSL
jgi:phosphate ABC transporter phosphate-binding protein